MTLTRMSPDRPERGDPWPFFEALCDCGGRQSGGEGERRAVSLIGGWGKAATGVPAVFEAMPYAGWHGLDASLALADGSVFPARALLRSAATGPGGLRARLIDLGRGSPRDFIAAGTAVRDRIVLVRHEAMFMPDTVHRSVKIGLAREAGAAGFVIAAPRGETMVAGSSGQMTGTGLPCLGVGFDTARRLAAECARHAPLATLRVATREAPAEASNVRFDLPGRGPGWVVLSAHLDGHGLSESAMDNASGAAVAMAVLEMLAPHAAGFARGLRVLFFNVEEWALSGSAHHVAHLSQGARDAIALNVNLDTVAGADRLTALISGYEALGPFLTGVAARVGQPLKTHLPFIPNSDHANFAQAGVPALRLLAGFGEPKSNTRHVLTPSDTRDKVAPEELRRAAMLTAAIVQEACMASDEDAAAWRRRAG